MSYSHRKGKSVQAKASVSDDGDKGKRPWCRPKDRCLRAGNADKPGMLRWKNGTRQKPPRFRFQSQQCICGVLKSAVRKSSASSASSSVTSPSAVSSAAPPYAAAAPAMSPTPCAPPKKTNQCLSHQHHQLRATRLPGRCGRGPDDRYCELIRRIGLSPRPPMYANI